MPVAASVGRADAGIRNAYVLWWVEGVVGTALVGLAGRGILRRE